MKTIFIFGTLTVLIGLISCKKNNETKPDDTVIYDTIKPLEYFPALPGSYWIYDNNDTLKVDRYEKYAFNSAGYTAEPDYDTLILPKLILNGVYNQYDSFAFVNGYSISKPSNSSYRDYAFKDLLAETVGSTFYISSSWTGHKNEGKTIKQDTTVFINGAKYNNVLITIQYDTYWQSMGVTIDNCSYLKEYYAKNVGLIKREKRNYPIDTVFVKDIELVKYDIKK